MLGILLSVLKISGILLLAVLALAVLVLAVILLVPVRYGFSGKFDTDEKKICGKITWFFRLVHISVAIDGDGMKITPKILGKEWGREKKKKKWKVASKEENREIRPAEKNDDEDTVPTKNGRENGESTEYWNSTEKLSADEKKDFSKKSIFDKIYDKIKSVIDFMQGKLADWKNFLQNVSEWMEKKDKIFDFFCEEETLDAKNRTFGMMKKAVRHICPYKLKAWVRFGLEYPDQTGQLYALLCVVYGIYGKNIVLEPDFENIVFEGNFYLKGRIRLLNMIYYVIYLYRIKKLREFIELMKNL